MNISHHTSRSFWQQPKKVALIAGIIIALWVLSGIIFPTKRDEHTSPQAASPQSTNAAQVAIQVESLTPQKRARTLTLNGVTEPERITAIEAETEGKISRILFKEGDNVAKGTVMIKLDIRDRQNSLNEARALLNQRRVELKAATKLYKKGFSTKVRLSQAKAAIASAERQLKQAQIDLSFTTIKAPYTGIVEEIMVEEGDLVGRGFSNQTVMRFVDLSPLKISGQISEMDRVRIKKGDSAKIRLGSGEEKTGTVGFIASVADKDTRTFRIEVAVPNPEYKLKAGISAELSLSTDEQLAYEVSSSVLALNDNGEVGVKTVNAKNIVKFKPVKVLSQSTKGVWITGLPDYGVKLVTKGVPFISEGQMVDTPKATPKAEANGSSQ